jgi:hypothetical protein
MTTTPIRVDLAEHDTHPILKWTLRDQAGALIDRTGLTKSVELYVWDSGAVGNVKQALWKATLPETASATTPEEKAEATFTPSNTEPYYPADFLMQGRGQRRLVGWLRYHDTASTPPTHKWIKNALEVMTEDQPAEPLP